MNTILVAVDGSEPGKRAARMAADIARRFDARLTLAHVVPPMPYPYEDYGWSRKDLDESHRKTAEALVQTAERELADFKIPISRQILWGSPADKLADAADDPSVDMVVVGSRGRNLAARTFLGSTSDRLVHTCAKPVLIVR